MQAEKVESTTDLCDMANESCQPSRRPEPVSTLGTISTWNVSNVSAMRASPSGQYR